MHAERLTRSDVIILSEPPIDHDLSLLGCGKPFGIEQLATLRAIEALVISILPGGARIDPDRFDTDTYQPFLQWSRYKLRAIVGSEILQLAVFQQERIKRFRDLCRTHLERHGNA